MKTYRFNKLENTRRDLQQAQSLVNDLQSSPNRPTNISELPIHGIRVLEKLGLIETWEDDNGQHWAITRNTI